MKIKAHAKINLGLDVVRKREDGYHELEMIMTPISLHDLIYIDKIDEGIEITSNSHIMPLDERNIMYKVAKLMFDTYHIQGGVKIHVYKHIPTQAGMAGGSADGAAVMRAINVLYHLNLDLETLSTLAKQIGADIPFCIYEQTAFVSGIGEKLDFFDHHLDAKILLVKPRKGVSTKRSFSELKIDQEIHPNCLKMKDALVNNNYEEMIKHMGNTLEGVSMEIVPDIKVIKEKMIEMGFDCALMSGSGSTVFGLTHDNELLENAMQYFRKQKIFAQKATFLSK